MVIDKEDFEVQRSNCYWAGRLLEHPQAWQIATEIAEVIDYALAQAVEPRNESAKLCKCPICGEKDMFSMTLEHYKCRRCKETFTS